MRTFNSPPEAFDYVAASLIPNARSYIIDISGPAEVITNFGCTVQVVDQNKVYGDGECGLTLHLPFDPESATHESFNLFQRWRLREHFDEVPCDGMPCFAMRFGSDVATALSITAAVLTHVFEYPPLTTFKCVVHED